MSENFYVDVSLLAVAVGYYATEPRATNRILAILLIILLHQAIVKTRLQERERALDDALVDTLDDEAPVGIPSLSILDASQQVLVPEENQDFDAPASFQRSMPILGPEFDKTNSTGGASATTTTTTTTTTTPSIHSYLTPRSSNATSSHLGSSGSYTRHSTISDDIDRRHFQHARPGGNQAANRTSFFKTMAGSLIGAEVS